MRLSVCIYIRNQLMVDLMQEFIPMQIGHLNKNHTTYIHKSPWQIHENIMYVLTNKTYHRYLGRPPIKYYQSCGIAIIDSGVKLRRLMLLIKLGLTPEEISCTLRGV